MKISRLPLSEIGRLKEIEHTRDPDPWVKEAEEFVFGGELAEFVRRYKEGLSVMIGEHEGTVVAVAVLYPDPRFFATRIGSIVVGPKSRRSGYGIAMLQGLVTETIRSGAVCWLVNKNNVGMLGCSRRVEPRPDEALLDDGYIMFVAP